MLHEVLVLKKVLFTYSLCCPDAGAWRRIVCRYWRSCMTSPSVWYAARCSISSSCSILRRYWVNWWPSPGTSVHVSTTSSTHSIRRSTRAYSRLGQSVWTKSVYCLLPDETHYCYNLHDRAHNRELHITSRLLDCNFLTRLLFKDSY